MKIILAVLLLLLVPLIFLFGGYAVLLGFLYLIGALALWLVVRIIVQFIDLKWR